MSRLDEAMQRHIESIVTNEHRPFSHLDFLAFEVDGQEYKMTHGTFRNKVSAMMKRGEVEVVSYSPQGFYTLKAAKCGKMMTTDHTGVILSSNLRYLKNHPVYKLIQNVPFEHSALHDIRLRFTVQGIWAVLSGSNSVDPVSKDIRLINQDINGLDIKVSIHHTDTVSVIIGCSYAPVAADVPGVIRLSNALTIIEERLAMGGLSIPNHLDWTVTMWHFGVDASVEYKGDAFHASWKVGENAIIALYSKEWKDGKCRIRAERQEYPGGPLAEVLEEKLEQNRSW